MAEFGAGSAVEALYSPVLWSWRPQAPFKAEARLERRLAAAAAAVAAWKATEDRDWVWRRLEGASPRPVLVSIFAGVWWTQQDHADAALASACLQQGVEHVGVKLGAGDGVEAQVEHVRATFRQLLRRLSDESVVTVCGFASGAHLAAMLLPEFAKEKCLRSFILISGLYDLRPLLWHSRHDSLHLTSDSAALLSPLLLSLPPNLARVFVLVAEIDSPVFHRQAEAFVEALKKSFIAARLSTVCAADQLEVGETLCDPKTPVSEFVVACAKGETPPMT